MSAHEPQPACVPRPQDRAEASRLGRLASASLHAELALAPKPGLVTPSDAGSHADMDARTFWRSLAALRAYFEAIAQAGLAQAPFDALRRLGLQAEDAMLRATDGINTHRGAIFSLGLLTAAAARLRRIERGPVAAEAVCHAVSDWRAALETAPLDPDSPGQRMRRAHHVAGVREQAAEGFPLLREAALPALRDAQQAGHAPAAAHAHVLMTLVAQVDDLNLLHRGGAEGLRFAQHQAHAFLARGSVWQPDWEAQLGTVGEAFVARRLSPGGSADLLACTLFLDRQARA
ncbi:MULTISPECIES: triphosphoribosyl-dephospho-CoA synthase MdcB [Pseudoxanthomonas]|uniref:Probable 2-(5''-triphosphoribosyl)-3'-dephosphocoenzyme-A synthase n=1 Tax=Pseudoxanthomonas winnipegensis TaxID=2480810 RepID=A0AAW8G6C8_9GAMM|nr:MULTISPECIES: triphosphoribosyl-dephospho-CoA synthase MdcB [Pseudoxanthomonas]MDQ1117816.1 triphosphoribosyl-dephospho-CoA synthase [Pseudoxanthomonas winnipegensis]MDQ1134785.1 triphosphoribosyl-dephospho-CoA synthase [Pseudoxanthomonas winnipegensis]MDR6138982.1 triphosphoribosyl-dephospho-CoA synthase [Pseudoxanthomonas sp. SORGH_AS_0997]